MITHSETRRCLSAAILFIKDAEKAWLMSHIEEEKLNVPRFYMPGISERYEIRKEVLTLNARGNMFMDMARKILAYVIEHSDLHLFAYLLREDLDKSKEINW